MRLNKLLLLSLLSFVSVFIIGVLAIDYSLPDGPVCNGEMCDSEIAHSINECKKNCTKEYVANIHECNTQYKSSINLCREQRRFAVEQCDNLQGKAKRDCVKEANRVSKECKADARTVKKQCKEDARMQKKQCRDICSDENVDGDNIPPEADNCDEIFNPDQSDSIGQGIGDACNELTCCVNANCFPATIAVCNEVNGVIIECVPLPGTEPLLPSVNVTYNATNITNPALTNFITNLTNALNSLGVNNTNYTAGIYDCDDFAHDLERNLTASGFNATYTYYWCTANPPSGYNVGAAPPYGHAVTDIHAPDGTIIFIEPQSNQIINLDFDGDGIVETRTNEHVNNINSLTDDSCAIEVYEDSGTATTAGTPRD